MYEVKLLKGTEPLRVWPSSTLAAAGQAYVNPGLLAPIGTIAQATCVTLSNPDSFLGGLRRRPDELIWIIACEHDQRVEVHELSYALLRKPLEKLHKQILAWFPYLDPWRAVAIASGLRDCAFMRLSKWVTLDLVEVDPRHCELKLLKRAQEIDNETS